MQRALRRIAERAGVSFLGESYPATYIEEAGESREFDRLSLELEAILKASNGQDAGSWREAEK